MGMDRNKLGRYHRNSGQSKSTLDSVAVVTIEVDILQFLQMCSVGSPNQQATKHQQAIAVTFKIDGIRSTALRATHSKHCWTLHPPQDTTNSTPLALAQFAQPPVKEPQGSTSLTKIQPIHFQSDSDGGMMSVYALGEHIDASGWAFTAQRSGCTISLRQGFRCRKLFQGGLLHGRCFEWYIVKDSNPFRHNHHKFVMHELTSDPATGILMRSSHKWYGCGKSAPQQMWDSMFKCEKGGNHPPGTKNGVRYCGFNDDAVKLAIDAADRADICLQDTAENHRVFGSKMRGDKSNTLSGRSMRALAQHANGMFLALLDSICPTSRDVALDSLRNSASWQELFEGSNGSEVNIKHPHFQGMADAHFHAPCKESKQAILSLFAPYYKDKLTMSLFDVDKNEVHAAKLHAAEGHAGVQIERMKHSRFSMDPQKFSFLHQWTRSKYAVTGGDAGTDDHIRNDIRLRLYKMYKKHALIEMPDKKPASMSKFYEEMGDGFCDQHSESCCCGQCIEGWTHISMMKEFVLDSSNGLDDFEAKAKRVSEIKKFLDYDFRWKHLQDSSTISTHCCNHALASPDACFNNVCDHDHENTCTECNMWAVLVAQIRAELSERVQEVGGLAGERPLTQECMEALNQKIMDLECRLLHVDLLDNEYHRYVSHIVRKHRSSRAQLLKLAEQGEREMFLTMDYKCKPLSRKNREGQGESFGKRGRSLAGIAAAFTVPHDWAGPLPKDTEREGDLIIVHVRVCADDADQSVWHSLQTFTTAILHVKAAYPWIESANLYTDGAVNFKSLLFLLSLPALYKRTGVRIKSHILPEAGDGKDRCDRDFAGVNKLFESWVKVDGRVMVTADDICDALEAGVNPGVINCALEIQRDAAKEKLWAGEVDTAKFSQMVGKKKEDLFYTEVVWEKKCDNDGVVDWCFSGLRFHAYHSMGSGKFLSCKDIDAIWGESRPTIASYKPHITRGTTLAEAAPAKELKIEHHREHKKRIKDGAQAKKEAMRLAKELTAQEEGARLAARRTSKRCYSCSRPFLRDFYLSAHEAHCQGQADTATERQQCAHTAFEFDILRGQAHSLSSNSTVLMPLDQVCTLHKTWEPHIPWKCSEPHIPFAIACVVDDMVDTIVYQSADHQAELARGWACREANVRPSHRFGPDVVQQLRWCFDRKPRMSPHHIEKHLKSHFGKYAGPKKCLRQTQIAGWITSEVGRRKKANVCKLVDAVSVAAVEVVSNAQDKATDSLVSLSYVDVSCSRGWSFSDALQRPLESELAATKAHEQELATRGEVVEVINKRKRHRCWEYECRWSGLGADSTTWQAASSLDDPVSMALIEHHEGKMRTQKTAPSIDGLMYAQCCNTLVPAELYDQSKRKCIPYDNAECIARRMSGKRSRHA